MNIQSLINVCALAALVGFMPTAIAAQSTSQSAESIAAEAADAAKSAGLLAIAADRAGTISSIASAWEAEVAANGGTNEEFTVLLDGASEQQLLDAQGATNYDSVLAILQGGDAPLSIDGVVGIEELGSSTQDLVYTPVVPCRIFDTRFRSGGPILGGGNPGSQLHYYVHGSGALMLPQGGNAAGCFAPKGEPSAIAANFTVVPSGTGHIRAWPNLQPQPNASFLNYQPGANLANAGIIATRFGAGVDISVSTWYGNSHSLADVMGYFYRAEVEKVVSVGTTSTSVTGPAIGTTYTTVLSRVISVRTSGRMVLMANATWTGTGEGWLRCRFTENGVQKEMWNWEPVDNVNVTYDVNQSRQTSFPVTVGVKTYEVQCYRAGGITYAQMWARNLTTLFVKSGN